jgi:outer membrane lipoprotein SlyB
MYEKYLAALLGLAVLTPGCATTTTSTITRTVPEAREGHVEAIREIVRTTEGNPGAGAVAGAIVGGFLGRAVTGSGTGSLIGALGGAAVGAGASQGHAEEHAYDVFVRFDDGDLRAFRYWGYPPFSPGQPVALTPRGLVARTFIAPPEGAAPSAPPPSEPSAAPEAEPGAEPGASPTASAADSSEEAAAPASPAPGEPPPPPSAVPPPPAMAAPSTPTAPPAAVPSGQWTYTQQYGWIWMPYGGVYTFTPDYENGDPYMYVYYPRHGWVWVAAPWLWGWGPRPYFGPAGPSHFAWYGRGWGRTWRGHRSTHYRYRYR